MDRTKASSTQAPGGKIVYSTTDGRQKFPDILQVTYGDKAVIGFDRYGRALGAVVPIEAVRMLAGWTGAVDERLRDHIGRAAIALLAELGENEPIHSDLVDVDTITAAREAASDVVVEPVRAAKRLAR